MARNSAGSASQHQFAKAPTANIQRSVFDRSASYKTTFDAGYLIPFFLDEILPGDTLKLTTNFLARLATPIFPYMDNVYLDAHYFFVPNRLVWDNWERFNGAQDNPGDSTDFLVPQLEFSGETNFTEGSIYDYLGIPTQNIGWQQPDMPQALPLRACNLIWNEWYRDENLQDSLEVPKDDGPDDVGIYALQRRGRRKDYFTSALPWPQKGPASVLPLGLSAPVVSDNTRIQMKGVSGPSIRNLSMGTSNNIQYDGALMSDGAAFGTNTGLYADLSEATAATINQLRQAATIQQLFETDARGGTRYIEILLAHFGVTSPDYRLQRPEFLGGGSINVNVNPIAQTAPTDTESPQGNLAAFATANGAQGFNHSFVEHGHVIGFLSVRAETSYQQGLNRMWNRRTRFDFYWPELAHLGEQTILNKEIYLGNDTAVNNLVFGYQERYAEYRYKPSLVTGKFRSNATGSLDSWHLALDFASLPTLAGLVQEDPPIDRIIAVPSEPQFILDLYTQMRHARPMPTYSVPGLTRL